MTPTQATFSESAVRLTSPLLVARNSFLSLCSELWTLVVIVLAMPLVVRALGPDSFGLFSLAWVVLGYMAILDFGVSRAATKFVSEHLSRDQTGMVEKICRTALAANLSLGLIGCAIAIALTPWLTVRIFHIPPQLVPEALRMFIALALAVPVLLIQAVLRAILSSYQRFGWISVLNAAAVTLQWASACVMAVLGFHVGLIVIVCVAMRVVITAGYAAVLATISPRLLGFSFSDVQQLWRLLRFGGWVTISQVMTPILLYLDRILVGSLISLTAMTLYVIPYEVISRLRVIPASLVNALFPSFSEHSAVSSSQSLTRLYSESLKYMTLILVPCFLFLAFLGSDLISAWIGPGYAVWGGRVLRILAGGALLNSLAYVPYTALVALGRPDLPAKLHLAELPLYVAASFLLIPRWGITGAAWAVTLRLGADAIALFWCAGKYVRCALNYQVLLRPLILNALLLLLLTGLRLSFGTVSSRLISGALCSIVYAITVWFLVLEKRERPLVLQAIQLRGRAA
jgi:O-antigen/teichoic acid export membrane protein